MDSFKKNLIFISTYGFLMMFLSLQESSATNTIFSNQSLSGFQTISSSDDVFELGFFSQGTSNLFYLGIWYKQIIPKTVVWVANREFPAQYITWINLHIISGDLVLYDNYTESRLWSTGLNSVGSADIQAVLLDNGNLVLRDGFGSASSSAILWQSFDNPSDTWLPGAKIRLENIRTETRIKFLTSWNTLDDPSPGRYSLQVDSVSRNSLIMVSNGSKSYWSSGAWDDQLRTFKKVKDMRFNRNLSFVFIVNESYVTYSVRYQTPFRLVMDVSGQLMAYSWHEKQQVWDSPWSEPDQKCKVYGYCGSFGICYDHSFCKCVPTFIPRYRSFLNSSYTNDSSSGCVNLDKYQCGKRNDKFLPLHNMKLATDPEERVLRETSFNTCSSACLAYCFCKAYAYEGNRCLIWTSNVFNLQELDANDSQGRTFYVRLTPSDISQAALNQGNFGNFSRKTKHRKVRTIVLAVSLPSLAAIALFIVLCYVSYPLRSKRVHKDKEQSKEGGLIDAEDENGDQLFYMT